MATPTSVVKSIVVIVIFTAASAGGGLIKLPSPVGSIALDSLPGFFAAAYFAPWIGGLVGSLGHVASAATAGFPLGPIHIVIALQMFCWCFIFGFIVRQLNRPLALVLASVIAILLNAVVSPSMLALIFPSFRPILMGLIGFLLLGSSANIVLAAVFIKILSKLDIPGI